MSETPIVFGAQFSAAVWIENSRGELLLQQRSSSEPNFPNTWCLPGGTVPKDVNARSVVVHRLMDELGLGTVNVPAESFRKDWVADGYGNYASFTLFVLRFPMELGEFRWRDHIMVPSVGFFDQKSLIVMKEEGSLHPATAYAVGELVEGESWMPLLKNYQK
ncbi:MAG: NUDIX domain-containing protein [Pseudomonadota bacterium]|nr:NUDIX domain-containing protein [Pseudomonadota bacterium]